MIVTSTFDSPIGALELARRGDALVELALPGPHARADVAERHATAERGDGGEPARLLAAYFAGDLAALDKIEVAPDGTPFQRAVWEALRAIPAGATAAYGDVARAVGRDRAVRAVGTATGSNPVAIVVPCHRVIRSDGSIGNYGGGVDRKVWLLEHERRFA